MNELEAAEKIRDGLLPSPTKFGGMTLFNLRVTGTGLSYRHAHEEYVWRDESIYLNDTFLRRCAGLPVIWDHPPSKPMLDSKEFNDRIIGTIMLPYIRESDVWAVCRLYDEDAIALMSDGQLSTSPAVVFKPIDGNEKVSLDNDETLLIEGTPSYLDHLAVCQMGVWDKGGPPVGVQNDLLKEHGSMADEEERAAADKARHDAEAKLDAIMDAFKRMDSRLDAFEKERKDAKRHDAARKDKFGKRKDGESYKDYSKRHDLDMQHMADALRKDSDEKEEDCMDAAKDARRDAEEEEKRNDKDFEKWAKEEEEEPEHKKDAEAGEDKKKEKEQEKAEKEEEEPVKDARKDSQLEKDNAELRLRLKALEGVVKGITTETPAAERDALAAAQHRADGVMAQLGGERAPAPVPGEASIDYRRRLANKLKKYSTRFKESRFDAYDPAALDLVEGEVYADAVASAKSAAGTTPGVLVPHVERDISGRQITRFYGDVGAFLEPFVPMSHQVVKINRNPNGGH
jgi:hypothetical protein